MTDVVLAHGMPCPGGFRPTRAQELLLKTALLPDERAAAAWREWRTTGDLNAVDSGAYRLLPLVYRNLSALGVQDADMERLKGVRRRTWYANQIIFRDLAGLLARFHQAGMETLVLKGAGLVERYYGDVGLRPMNDFDIMVRPERAADGMRLLKEAGWLPRNRAPRKRLDRYCRFIHSLPFWRKDHPDCDLHWHVFPECCYAGADEVFWSGSEAVEFHGVRAGTLNATDHVLHACIHGARWNEVPPLRWLPDTMMILRSSGATVDWDRLVREAVERRLVLPLREALGYLVNLLDAPVPHDVIERLARTPVSAVHRLEYRARTARPGLLGFLPEATLRHLAYARGNRLQRLATLPRAYQYTWEVDHLWQVPFCAAFKSVRRTAKKLAL